MDLETENRIAAILMKEAAELRRQAEKEGVHVYLERPKVRGRPNSRFLTATVLGVQQANRAVEINEMWQLRQKELELDSRPKGRSRHENHNNRTHRNVSNSSSSKGKRDAVNDKNASASCSSSKRGLENSYLREGKGLKDDEIEKFLHSRIKRGRGAVGARMDETGPYLPLPNSEEKFSTSSNVKERVTIGPEKPPSLKSCKFSEEELDEERQRTVKKVHLRSSDKKHSKKHRSKEKSRDKKKRRKERSKH